MAASLILEFEGVGKEQYDAVNGELGIDTYAGTGDWPAGLTSHVAGTTPGGGLVVMEIWESQDAQAAFMNERLGAALGKAGVPAPVRVTWLDLLADTRP